MWQRSAIETCSFQWHSHSRALTWEKRSGSIRYRIRSEDPFVSISLHLTLRRTRRKSTGHCPIRSELYILYCVTGSRSLSEVACSMGHALHACNQAGRNQACCSEHTSGPHREITNHPYIIRRSDTSGYSDNAMVPSYALRLFIYSARCSNASTRGAHSRTAQGTASGELHIGILYAGYSKLILRPAGYCRESAIT